MYYSLEVTCTTLVRTTYRKLALLYIYCILLFLNARKMFIFFFLKSNLEHLHFVHNTFSLHTAFFLFKMQFKIFFLIEHLHRLQLFNVIIFFQNII